MTTDVRLSRPWLSRRRRFGAEGVLTVEYGDRKLDRLAWDAIDRGEPLDVVVRD